MNDKIFGNKYTFVFKNYLLYQIIKKYLKISFCSKESHFLRRHWNKTSSNYFTVCPQVEVGRKTSACFCSTLMLTLSPMPREASLLTQVRQSNRQDWPWSFPWRSSMPLRRSRERVTSSDCWLGRSGQGSVTRFNIKMSSYQYRKSHCGDKTVVRTSYLHNGVSYSGKMSSLYWIRAQGPVSKTIY